MSLQRARLPDRQVVGNGRQPLLVLPGSEAQECSRRFCAARPRQHIRIPLDDRFYQVRIGVGFFIDRKQVFDSRQHEGCPVSLKKFRQAIRDKAKVAQQLILGAFVTATTLPMECNGTTPRHPAGGTRCVELKNHLTIDGWDRFSQTATHLTDVNFTDAIAVPFSNLTLFWLNARM